MLESHREDRTRAARARRSSRADAGRRKRAASKRWSTRIFGEYAFLEDSRYASQAKNARGKNSHTVATVNSSELGKSAPSAAPATPPRREHRGDPRYCGRHEGRLCPDARSRRHRDGGQRVVSVNTFFWKILVTRVKRKMQQCLSLHFSSARWRFRGIPEEAACIQELH